MAKRVREEDELKFPLLDLPDDMIKLIVGPLKENRTNWLFGFLFLNRNCYERFPRIMRVIYNEGCHITDEWIDSGFRCPIPFRGLARNMAGHVLSITARERMCGITIPCFYNLDSLVLYGRHSVEIESLLHMSRLTHLDLSYNRMEGEYTQYVNIHLLTGLKSLVLKENTTVRALELCQLTNLTKLDLSHNNHVKDDKTILYLPRKLCSLDLTHNEVIDDCDLRQLTNLTSLDLTMNRRIANDGVSRLVNLESLKLPGSNIAINEESLTLLTKLRELTTRCQSNNYMYAYCASRMPSLCKLTVGDCFDTRPFKTLTNITKLEVVNNMHIFTLKS